MKKSKPTITVQFTDFDIEILLTALGTLQQKMWDSENNTNPVNIVITKIYRAMGVKL